MKKRRLIAGIILIVLAIAAIITYRVYNKPPRQAIDEEKIIVAAIQLAKEYEANEAEANKKYLDNVLKVSGTITDISSNQAGAMVITLQGTDMAAVQCTLLEPAQGIGKGAAITIIGFCTGYLTDVVLNRCVVDGH